MSSQTTDLLALLELEQLDLNPPGGPGYNPTIYDTRQEVLDAFDANVAKARAAIAGASDQDFAVNWSLLSGGAVVMLYSFTLPAKMRA